jgi:hypothetical protein
MIVEVTNYFAKPGHVAEVLVHRRRGSALRKDLGLPAGKIFVKLSGDGPDVRWECAFATMAEFEADMAARAKSPEFGNQRKQMSGLLERFERHVQESDVED